MLRSNVRLSDVSVRLSTTLDSAATLTDGDMSRPATPSYKSQLRGGTHGQRYVQRVRLATPSNNFRGYSHSPISQNYVSTNVLLPALTRSTTLNSYQVSYCLIGSYTPARAQLQSYDHSSGCTVSHVRL